MNHLKRVFVLGGIMAAAMSSAVNWSMGAFGGALPDNNTISFDTVVSGTGLIITSTDRAVLAQMTHTWMGDMRVTLTHMASGTSVHLFHFAQGNGDLVFGDSTNLGNAGNYTFQMGAAQSMEQAAALLGDTQFVPDGIYRPAGQVNFGSTVNGPNSVNSNFAVFNGLALDGTWRMTFHDRAGGDTGALGHWELHGTGNPVPEPATIAALGLGAAALLRRRRKATA